MPKTCVAIVSLLLLLAWQARAQQLTIRSVNGKTGKPLADKRLLIFLFNNLNDRHEYSTSVTTNAKGFAVFDAKQYRLMQTFPDFMTACITNPNLSEISLRDIAEHGVQAENNCGPDLHLQKHPGEVLFFMREATLREKMAW